MSEDQFTKLFKYIEDFRQEVSEKFEETNSRIDHLAGTIDAFIKRLDNYEAEQAARDAQFDRLLAWAKKVSEKTGIPLEGF